MRRNAALLVCMCVCVVCGFCVLCVSQEAGQRERFDTHEDDGHLQALLACLLDNAARMTVVVKDLVCYAATITNEHFQNI